MNNVCICCGVEFIEGKGWAGPHTFPCANDRYGWAWTVTAKEFATRTLNLQHHDVEKDDATD